MKRLASTSPVEIMERLSGELPPDILEKLSELMSGQEASEEQHKIHDPPENKRRKCFLC